jgi:thymidine phosphorylase
MQTAGMEVHVAVAELGAGVQRGQDQLQGRLLVLGVQIDRDTAAIVADGDSIAALVQRNGHGVGEAVEVFIDRVIEDLPDEVVQPFGIDAANVHRRPLAHGLQTFENSNILGGVSSSAH